MQVIVQVGNKKKKNTNIFFIAKLINSSSIWCLYFKCAVELNIKIKKKRQAQVTVDLENMQSS